MRTVEKIIIDSFKYIQNKHELEENWTEETINEMNNLELIERLSDAIEERLEYHLEKLIKLKSAEVLK